MTRRTFLVSILGGLSTLALFGWGRRNQRRYTWTLTDERTFQANARREFAETMEMFGKRVTWLDASEPPPENTRRSNAR